MDKIKRQKLIDQGYYREVYNKLDELVEGYNEMRRQLEEHLKPKKYEHDLGDYYDKE